MRKKVLGTILTVVMTLSLLLVGCGGEENESQEGVGQNNEVQQEQNEDLVQGDLFSGTIFDELVIGETTTTEVEALLEERILEYEYEYVENAISSLSGVTTITDEFYEYDALYRYILLGGGKKADYILTEWTVELLLNEDSEYKDVVKRIQDVIDENALTEYTPLENSYSDSLVKGSVIYYPIKKFVMNDKDFIQYIMFGKFANCDSEDAKHIVVMSVGIITEANYQTGEIVKLPTFTVEPIEINPEIWQTTEPTEPTEMNNYQNIAFFITDTQCRCTTIISIASETEEIKMVSIPRKLYLNIGNRYGHYFNSYGNNNVEQAIKTLNTNLDIDIRNFIAIDLKTFSEFVDILGGVWVDVQNADTLVGYNEFIMSMLETDETITLNEGYQLLSGDQVAMYCWHLGTKSLLDSQLSDVFLAIHKQMQSVDEETLQQAIDLYTDSVYTSIDIEVIREEMANISEYDYDAMDGAGFPQEGMREEIKMGSMGLCYIPVDLESNVIWLHKFLFDQDNYEVSETVKEYSEQIEENAEEYRTE